VDRAYLDAVRRSARSRLLQAGPANVNRWPHACLALGLLTCHRALYESDDLNAVLLFADSIVDAHGEFVHPVEDVSGCMIGPALLDLFERTAAVRYRRAAEAATRFLLDRHVKTPHGTLPYDSRLPSLVLVDTLPMVCPLLARYGVRFEVPEATQLAVVQLREFLAHGRSAASGLPFHAFQVDGPAELGMVGWTRGTGWLAMALVDTLAALPNDHEARSELAAAAVSLAEAVRPFQTENGLWRWAVPALGGLLDTSGSAMIGYATARAVELGVLDISWWDVVERAAAGIAGLTRADGTVDKAQGECIDVGLYPATSGPAPWAQGPAVALAALVLARRRTDRDHRDRPGTRARRGPGPATVLGDPSPVPATRDDRRAVIAETRETPVSQSRSSTRGINVWLVGHAGCYNRGCEAIVRSTASLLDERFGPCRYTLWSDDPGNDAAIFNGGAFRVADANKRPGRFDGRRISRKLGHLPGGNLGRRILRWLPGWPDCALSIGGDNFTLDYGAPKSFVSAGTLLMDAGIPLVIWGASIGPFSADARIEAQMAEFLARVDLITVRESRSVDYLRSLGIERNVRRVYDPAFALEPEPYNGPEAAMVESGDTVGLNVSALIARWFPGEDLGAMLDEVAGFVRHLVGEGFKILLVPHVTAKGRPLYLNDEEVLRRLSGRLEHDPGHVALLPGTLSAGQLKGMIARCRFFIGARTHSTIAAFSTGVPTIAIGYSQKARGICEDLFGSVDYLVPTSDLSTETLLAAWHRLRRDEEQIRRVLEGKRPTMLAEARRNAEALEELLRG